MKKLYESAGALENTFVFKIPVYENMPASPLPDADFLYQCGIAGTVGL